MNYLKANLRNEIERLAEEAFHRRLISGYGTGEYPNAYQIVYRGKPRHLALEYAYTFLRTLLNRQQHTSLLN